MSFARTSLMLVALLSLATEAQAGRPKLKKLDVASIGVAAPFGVCPGQAAQLSGVVTLSDGRMLHTRTDDGGRGELRPGDLKLDLDQKDARLDAHDRVFLPNVGRSLVGAVLPVAVRARGLDLEATAHLPLTFDCEVALDYTAEGRPGEPWVAPKAEQGEDDGVSAGDVAQLFLPVAMVTGAARSLREARPLLVGDGGANGVDGTGDSGAPGGVAHSGGQGHDLVVTVEAYDGLVLATIVDQTTGDAREVVVDPTAGGLLRLVTRGGRGGMGGSGGDGGDGVPGVEVGGPGGRGGAGGDGGAGGRGGDVTVRTPANRPEWKALVVVDAAGGPGGFGGKGGAGGFGGSPNGDRGEDGDYGRDGEPGTPGNVVWQAL